MTTLQLAEAICRAVLAEVDEAGVGDGSDFGFLLPHDDYFPDTAKEFIGDLRQTVFKVLRDNDCWFCRVQLGPPPVGGIIASEQMELFDVG